MRPLYRLADPCGGKSQSEPDYPECRGCLCSDFRQADERGKENLLRGVGNHRSDCCGAYNLYKRQHQVHNLVYSGKQGGKQCADKLKDRYEGNAPATATYILIEGSYTPQNGTARDVSYAIYLGAGNSAADFNVVRNTKYAVNAAIKGTDMNDGRVLIGRDLSAAGTQTANCYVVKTTDANKWYRFKATIRGNGAETPAQISYTGAVIPANDRIAPTNAALVWETREGGNISYFGLCRLFQERLHCIQVGQKQLRVMQWLLPKTVLPLFGAGISGLRQRSTEMVSKCRHMKHGLVTGLRLMPI